MPSLTKAMFRYILRTFLHLNNDDAADFVNEEDRYKYIDELTILELIALT